MTVLAQNGVTAPLKREPNPPGSVAPAHTLGMQRRQSKRAGLQRRFSILQQRVHRHGLGR
jgi:hypothetical protein